MKHKYTFGEKCADGIASFGGSWNFIFLASFIIIAWMAWNIYTPWIIDPAPFIGLNLILSCVAAFQAPFLLMSSNRQSQIDRKRSEDDFKLDKEMNKKIDLILEILKNSNLEN